MNILSILFYSPLWRLGVVSIVTSRPDSASSITNKAEFLSKCQLLKQFSCFYEILTHTTLFQIRCKSYPEASLILFIPCYSTPLRSTLVLSSHLRLGFSNSLFPYMFSTEFVYAFLCFLFLLYLRVCCIKYNLPSLRGNPFRENSP